MGEPERFTPALGYNALTPLYDIAIAALTREHVWRRALTSQVEPKAGDRILDVGCGTGSLALQIKMAAPDAYVIGIDPDPEVLSRASHKAKRRQINVEWRRSFLTSRIAAELGPLNKIVSSLVFHQTPLDEKARILRTMYGALVPGGELHIADYGLQRTKIMKFFFRKTVQTIDGIRDTQPNADGVLAALIEKAGFADIKERQVIDTPTGSISLYCARRPDS